MPTASTTSPPGPVAQAIRAKLTAALTPERLDVLDESYRHTKHADAPAATKGGGETHFRVTVIAAPFAGLSRLERHRKVNEVLAAELAGPVFALSIHAFAPGERLPADL